MSEVVSAEEYEVAIDLNRKLLAENTELKIKISYLQKRIAELMEANYGPAN